MSSWVSAESMAGLTGIAISGDTAYCVTFGTNDVYAVDLQTGSFTLLANLGAAPGPGLYDAALDGSILYTAGGNDNIVYAIDVETGAYSIVTPMPVPGSIVFNGGLFGVGLYKWPGQIPVFGLTGNSLRTAKYLNANAPEEIICSLERLGGRLNAALEAIAPTRNAYAAYASQIGALNLNNIMSSHNRIKRLNQVQPKSAPVASNEIPIEKQLADANWRPDLSLTGECCDENSYTVWAASVRSRAYFFRAS